MLKSILLIIAAVIAALLAYVTGDQGASPFDGKRMFWGGFKEIARL